MLSTLLWKCWPQWTSCRLFFLSCRQIKWSSVYLPGSLAEIGWQSHKKKEMFRLLEGDIICKSMNDLPFRNFHKWLLMVVWQTLPNRVWINVVIVLDLLFPFLKNALIYSNGAEAIFLGWSTTYWLRGHMSGTEITILYCGFLYWKKSFNLNGKSSFEPLTILRPSNYLFLKDSHMLPPGPNWTPMSKFPENLGKV